MSIVKLVIEQRIVLIVWVTIFFCSFNVVHLKKFSAGDLKIDHVLIQEEGNVTCFVAKKVTSTSLKIETTITTSTVPNICAILLNVTGVCQRRRRRDDGDIQKPIVISFDEEDAIDLENPSPVQT